MTTRIVRVGAVRAGTFLAAVCAFVVGGPVALAGIAFQYDPIEEPIVSACFSIDLAAMNAHRYVGDHETNFAVLVDCDTPHGLPDYDLSDDLFGTSPSPGDPQVDMGPLETGWISAEIESSFFPALAGGNVGLRALFTDTVDAMFAVDFVGLTIVTDTGVVESHYGWPVGDENNGFGIGLADGGDLPAPLPESLPPGSTGTGFDETISSVSILAIPEPGGLALLALSGLALVRRSR